MLLFLAVLLVPGGAQVFENTNDDAKTFIHRNHQGRNALQQPKEIPDIVVEKNGDSQFNSGPLPLSSSTLSRNHKHRKDRKIFVQSTTSVDNRAGKSRNNPNRHKNNRRPLLTTTSRQRNNSVRNEKVKIETPARITPTENYSARVPVESAQNQQDHFDSEYEDEETSQDSRNSFARTENQTFQDSVPANTFATYANGHSSYVFPEKQHPLKECFYNPSGYACCNRNLNDEIVRTYEQLANDPYFNMCNIQKLTNILQRNCSRRFRVNFEVVVGLADYAQRVNFRNDLVCKVELGGRYMLAYATPEHSGRAKRTELIEQAKNTSPDEPLLEGSSSTPHSPLI